MILTDIHKNWATRVEFEDPMEFFQQPANFWRDLIYKRKLLIFKKMTWSKEDYAKFSLYFGKPWPHDDYDYSEEQKEDVITDKGTITLSPFSNKTSRRLRTKPMTYHADIPNRSFSPFPFRSLWITKNPRPEISGITGFLYIGEESFKLLTKEQLELFDRVRIVQQSWYKPGTDFREYDFIKVHPITGERSLRLNYYCKGENQGAWIKYVKIDGVQQPDNQLIEDFTNHLLQFEELQYFHTWDTNDILMYDNYPFIHNRSSLILEPGEERHFYRIHVDHDPDWKSPI